MIELPRTFRQNTHGRDVFAVKRALHAAGYIDLDTTTRVFGARAVLQLRLAQHDWGLSVSGVYGPKSHAKLWPYVDGRGARLFRLALEARNALPVDVRGAIVKAMYVPYQHRSSVHYTQGPRRWSGIDDHLKPPYYPPSADCSALVTWGYWTQLGDGPDILNGQDWKAGYTGTQLDHGKPIEIADLRPADLVFYYHRDDPAQGVGHVGMCVDDGHVIEHGSEAGPLYERTTYRPVAQCRSYLP